jgi:hypothetical protein
MDSAVVLAPTVAIFLMGIAVGMLAMVAVAVQGGLALSPSGASLETSDEGSSRGRRPALAVPRPHRPVTAARPDLRKPNDHG